MSCVLRRIRKGDDLFTNRSRPCLSESQWPTDRGRCAVRLRGRPSHEAVGCGWRCAQDQELGAFGSPSLRRLPCRFAETRQDAAAERETELYRRAHLSYRYHAEMEA